MTKVFLVIVDAVTDYVPTGSIKVFANRKDAEEEYLKEVRSAKLDAEEDWIVEESEELFETYEDGYYVRNNISVTLEEKEVK